MKKYNSLINFVIVMAMLFAALAFPLQDIAMAEESLPEAPDAVTASMPPPIIEFNGIDREDYDPAPGTDPFAEIPDTAGAAGHTHFLQAVNKAISLYRKDGTQIDVADLETFWSYATTGTDCDGVADNHKGQPTLIYDHIFGRWVVVDVAYDTANVTTGPYYLCIAVSNSLQAPMAPAVGTYFTDTYWYYYAVSTYGNGVNHYLYPDSPKLGLWPDGYYLATDLYELDSNGQLDDPRGAKVYAFNRFDLTNGVTAFHAADFYLEEEQGVEHLVPSNLLGTPPSSGTPNYFVSVKPGDLYIWEFHVDWNNISDSWFGDPNDLLEYNYKLTSQANDWPIGYIIPQNGSPQKVKALGDQLSSPVQYRILDGVPSLWANHTVYQGNDTSPTGIAWYELQFNDGVPFSFQQGTYEPNNHYRWLGSLATDRIGNMALGFSVSSASIHPAIKYVGRLKTDNAGELPQTETFLNMNGTALPYYVGAQDDGNAEALDGPWGRQSQMSIDPMDECVFWYTNMYYDDSPDSMMWRTRIGWFGFPECRGGDTKRVSLHTNGYEGNDDSGLDYLIDRMYQVGISATGRYVVFSSEASNLVDSDTNDHRDIFLRDRDTDDDGIFDEPGNVTTTRISMGHDGSEGNNDSWEVSISYNGRYIAYSSFADNLVPSDLNGARDVFLYDRVLDQTTLVSVAHVSGDQGQGNSDHAFVSGDGAYVAFRSVAPNLVAGDTNDAADIFVRHLASSSTTRVSVDSGTLQGDAQSYNPTISETGRYVAFGSDATNLVAGDGNGVRDVFVHDQATGVTTRVSISTSAAEGDADSYTPFISGNGNFVVFTTDATNLDDIVPDTNLASDIYVHDMTTLETTRVSINFFGVESSGGDSFTPSISREGRYISFASEAQNLDVTLQDSNGRRDIFLHDRQLALEGIYDFGLTTRISLDKDGGEPNAHSFNPMVAAYGRHVAFVSEATDLVVGDNNDHWDVFAYDSERIVPTFLSIPGNIPANIGAMVTVPVMFSGNNSHIDTTTFSIDFDHDCLAFDDTDSDSNGVPDAVVFMINSNFVTTAEYNGSDVDGEIDISIYDQVDPRTAIPDGTIVTIEFQVKATCAAPPGSTRSARVGFSKDPAPSFGSLGVSVEGLTLDGFVRILAGQLGDCNGDGTVDAGDLSALVLEIFDGDGALPADTPNINPLSGVFAGNPVGCNPNQDYVVDAGDISCTVMIIFGNTGCTGIASTNAGFQWFNLAAPVPEASSQTNK